jgi:RNA polymerase sigma-70 factor (ECF subfamily)
MDWQSTSSTLLQRLRDTTDAEAWREFDRRYGELIVRYCRARGLQQADAEDIRQLVLLSLSKGLPGFEYSPGRGRFRAYLATCIRNTIFRWSKRPNALTDGLPEAEEAVVDGSAPETDVLFEQEWVRHHFRLAMSEVRRSFDQRSIEVFDRLLRGGSFQTVAAELSTTPEAVRKVKDRIRDRLRAIIAHQLAMEDQVHRPVNPDE